MLDSTLAALIPDRCLHLILKGYDEAVEFLRATDLQKDVEQPFSAVQVKGHSQILEGYVDGLELFSACLLKSTKEEYQVH